MDLAVVGAGYGRTGTLSLKLALDQLGFGPCYHMLEAWNRPDHREMWSRAIDGEQIDWHVLFADFRSTCDWPACSFWMQIKEANPGAKVVLTRRDPDHWYASISRTIFEQLERVPDDEDAAAWRAATRKLIIDKDFGGRTERAHAIAALQAYEADVIASVAADQLLVYEVAQGWGPLCAFLGVDVPEAEFPRTNSAAEFRTTFGLDEPG